MRQENLDLIMKYQEVIFQRYHNLIPLFLSPFTHEISSPYPLFLPSYNPYIKINYPFKITPKFSPSLTHFPAENESKRGALALSVWTAKQEQKRLLSLFPFLPSNHPHHHLFPSSLIRSISQNDGLITAPFSLFVTWLKSPKYTL